MKLSPEFARELKKATKLSVFITVLALGLLAFGVGKVGDQRENRSIASENAVSTDSAEGMRESSPRRSVPPYERQ